MDDGLLDDLVESLTNAPKPDKHDLLETAGCVRANLANIRSAAMSSGILGIVYAQTMGLCAAIEKYLEEEWTEEPTESEMDLMLKMQRERLIVGYMGTRGKGGKWKYDAQAELHPQGGSGYTDVPCEIINSLVDKELVRADGMAHVGGKDYAERVGYVVLTERGKSYLGPQRGTRRIREGGES